MESVYKHVSQYPPGFEHGVKHWEELARRKGAFCGAEAVEAFDFVTPPPDPSPDTEVINELLRNRATDAPWGWAESDKPRPADS